MNTRVVLMGWVCDGHYSSSRAPECCTAGRDTHIWLICMRGRRCSSRLCAVFVIVASIISSTWRCGSLTYFCSTRARLVSVFWTCTWSWSILIHCITCMNCYVDSSKYIPVPLTLLPVPVLYAGIFFLLFSVSTLPVANLIFNNLNDIFPSNLLDPRK